MVRRTRDIQKKIWLTPQEERTIAKKMEMIGTENFGAYARKMLIDGYIIVVDYTEQKKLAAEINKIGVNINTVCRRINSTGRFYQDDIDELKENSGKVDLILFGETFLQGFEALDWKYETDQHMALSVSDSNIQTIQKAAEENALAVSFGFLEKAEDKIYSSQLTIGADGNILNLFRRVSKGWRESFTDEHYAEGDMFTKFEYLGNTFSIGLCGDLWDEKNVMQIKKLRADVVLWPVYTDFSAKEWNKEMKYEYAAQSKKIGRQVLLVNSVSLSGNEEELAKGGAVCFLDGQIKEELPAGKEGVLMVQV